MVKSKAMHHSPSSSVSIEFTDKLEKVMKKVHGVQCFFYYLGIVLGWNKDEGAVYYPTDCFFFDRNSQYRWKTKENLVDGNKRCLFFNHPNKYCQQKLGTPLVTVLIRFFMWKENRKFFSHWSSKISTKHTFLLIYIFFCPPTGGTFIAFHKVKELIVTRFSYNTQYSQIVFYSKLTLVQFFLHETLFCFLFFLQMKFF